MTWQDPVSEPGDGGAWWSDPAQPERVLENAGRDIPPGLGLYTASPSEAYPNAADGTARKAIPAPGRCTGGSIPNRYPTPDRLLSCPAGQKYIFDVQLLNSQKYRPIIFTLASEEPLPDGDYIIIRGRENGTQALLRVKNKISEITKPTDWDTKASQEGQDLPGTVDRVQASGGHDSPVYYVGDGTSLWRSRSGMWQQIVPAPDGTAREARRFFVNPYDPNVIYIIDRDAIRRSDNGQTSDSRGPTWQVDVSLDRVVTDKGSSHGAFSYEITNLGVVLGEGAVIKDMIFDRNDPRIRFAVGNAGVFMTVNSRHWERIFSTTASPGHPISAFFDPLSVPSDPSLYVAFNGRSMLQLHSLPALRERQLCDIDRDSDVDRTDIEAIFAARNTPANSGDRRDVDNDGMITVNDARICTLRCTNPNCAP